MTQTTTISSKAMTSKWMSAFGTISTILLLPFVLIISSESTQRSAVMVIDSIEDYVYVNFIDEVDQDHRQLQRSIPVCVNTQRDFWETFVVRRRFALNYYLRRGAAQGTCGEACESVCDHNECVDDYKIGTDDLTCTCLEETISYCKDNAFCDQAFEECRCNDRYEGDPLVGCTDIDECKQNICGTAGVDVCTNLPGSYTCGCKAGFQFNGTYGTGCRDVDECTELGTNPCGANSICSNVPGSFTCFCRAGYQGKPPTVPCVDFNECLSGDKCGQFGTCVNTDGGFQCNCRTGFTWPGPSSICVDINECTTNPCTGRNQQCANTIGGFSCSCTPGYEGFPNCVDVNDCAKVPPVCGANSVCGNTDGSFVCRCDPNFPGGNPPSEPCRKLNAGEICSSQSSTECSSGLECAQISRSDTNLNCCASASRCNVNNRCCNGAYGQGEACPSGANEDCETGLSCVRRSLTVATKVCCRKFLFVPGLGNVCDT